MRLICYLLLIVFLLSFWGCEMPPLYVYFRNYSANSVKLSVTIFQKERYPRLPNQVTFYDTASKRKNLCGNYKSTQLVSWIDSLHFEINIPPYTVIDINDIASGRRRLPEIILIASTPLKSDTLLNTDYYSISNKFHFKGGFSKYKFYYDFE